MAKAPAIAAKKTKAPSKSEVLANIASATNLSKKDVAAVLDALGGEIKKALGKKGPGQFQIHGLIKISKKHVDAKPARKNAPDPFNPGQFRDYAAKPATTKIKVNALKNLRAMV
ncbi:MAG TPA: HU family DNA-binding protein [Pirellulales bacterium]|nr:HU family DNA-binding protein [Pirellulales bacterium]